MARKGSRKVAALRMFAQRNDRTNPARPGGIVQLTLTPEAAAAIVKDHPELDGLQGGDLFLYFARNEPMETFPTGEAMALEGFQVDLTALGEMTKAERQAMGLLPPDPVAEDGGDTLQP